MNIFKRQIAEVPDVTQINPVLDESVVKRGSRVFRNAVRWFKAGVSDRLTSAWPSTPIPADLIVERYQRTLVARSREQCANNDYGRNYLRLTHQNIVGPQGVMLQAQIRNAQGKLDNKLCDAVEQEWSNWNKKNHCDIQGKKSWRSIQRSCVISAAKDGEFFVRIIVHMPHF